MPKGCVLSTFLYFFDQDYISVYGSNTMIKYGEDTAVVRLEVQHWAA